MKAYMSTAVFALLGLYLFFWPVPIDPTAWEAPPAPKYEGVFAPNTELAELSPLPIGGNIGPEDISSLMTKDGLRLYTGTHDGQVLEVNPEDKTHKIIAHTGGVPLGIEAVNIDGRRLIIADAYMGLLSVRLSGEVEILTDHYNGDPIRYADDLDIDENGIIYFSDASTRHSAKAVGDTLTASVLEIMEMRRSGRVFTYDLRTDETTLIKNDLSFPNGIAMGPEGRSIFIVETGRYRILRHWLDGERRGQSEIILDNLPGFPDNINRAPNGHYFIGLVSQRTAFLDRFSSLPFIRKMALRLPAFLRPKPVSYGFIIEINAKGEIIRTWQDPKAAYPSTTGAHAPGDGHVYITSLTADKIAYRPYP